VIEQGVLSRLERHVTEALGDGRLFVVYDANLFALHGRAVQHALRRIRGKAIELVIPSGEHRKNASTLKGVYDFLLDNKIARDDFILACGGGVTGDLAGFAAATILRGVSWGVVPTTVIGMADASIGGKTGLNHSLGKNLIGAFWAPSFVLCDPGFLSTLPKRHLVSGLGEIIKCAGLAGAGAIDRCEQLLDRIDSIPTAWEEPIRQAAAYKAAIVSRDELETGKRVWLNFGHTFGHAVEMAAGYGRLLHGEAVLLGLLAALELGREMAPAGKLLTRYTELVKRAVRLIPKRRLDSETVLASMALDKKRQAADLRYVLLRRPGRPVVRSGFRHRQVKAALNRMLRFYEAHGGKGDTHSRNPRT